MSPTVPRQIGAIRVGALLGEGGMAQVFQAQDLFHPEQPLAVKFLRPEAAADREGLQRFLREGEVLKELRHPHLVEVYATGTATGRPYLLMELLPGGNLQTCWGAPPVRVVQHLLPVADALAFAHRHGIIHRDLKPSNLLFAADGRLKVTDFGVCLWESGAGERVTRSRMVVGTLGYMAPEQHGDPRRVDGRCDVFALAAILYTFTTGQPWSQVQLPPAAVRPGFPPRLARLLLDGLAADPQRRTASMDLFRDALGEWLEGAEAAGWGAGGLPGHSLEAREAATCARPRTPEPPESRLGPYLDALQNGSVGARRAAAEGLLRQAESSDETFLLGVLGAFAETGRFAVATALGKVGTARSLGPLLGMLNDPYAQREALEAATQIARREDRQEDVKRWLVEPSPGPSWQWHARASLGDPAWSRGLLAAWDHLSSVEQKQALEAALALPVDLKRLFHAALQPWASPQSSSLRASWRRLAEESP